MPDAPDEMHRDIGRLAKIFDHCMDLFRERNAKYKGAFKVGGVVDNAFQLRHKAIRMLQKCEDYQMYLAHPEAYVRGYGIAPEKPRLDDAYDLINYTCFLIICILEDLWIDPPARNDRGEAICTCTVDSMCAMHLHAMNLTAAWMKANPQFAMTDRLQEIIDEAGGNQG